MTQSIYNDITATKYQPFSHLPTGNISRETQQTLQFLITGKCWKNKIKVTLTPRNDLDRRSLCYQHQPALPNIDKK